MKSLIYISLIAFFSLSLGVSHTELAIEINGLKNNPKGLIRVGVFKKDGFGDASKAVEGTIEDVNGTKMNFNFTSLAPGTYAVIIVQDQNKDGKLSKNFVGYPTEPYGFSKNKYGTLGPPDFKDVCFQLEAGKKVNLQIQL